ncbi:oligosaccharide flippase family protein [Marivirga arenosa]|uniref:Oligosaccharide flippase family protein n=1 Tax=Marivirga arenosa TaxID=3059076 RepID=A0AA51NBH9_9BACT|nr:oligosaccharide flippase family protein [Marivirga sp. ABR2-2]WMN08055.1 oligosaccharide flippase family protein [Marivirga sp. ABR2-2]
MSIAKNFVRNTKWNSLIVLYNILIQFSQLTLLTYILTVQEMGVVGVIAIFLGIYSIFTDFGLGRAIIQDENFDQTKLSSALWIGIFASIIFSLIFLLCSPLISEVFNYDLFKIILYSPPIIIINTIGNPYHSVLQKELMFKEITKINFFANSVSFVSVLMFAWFDHGPISIIYGNILMSSINTLGYIYYYPLTLEAPIKFSWIQIKPYVSFGLYQTGERLIGILRYHFDKFLIGAFLGLEVLGVYNIAWNILIMPISKLNPILLKVAYPVFAKIKANENALHKYYASSIKAVALINFPILCGISIVAHEFISIFYKPEYELAGYMIVLLSLAFYNSVIGSPAGTIIVAKGQAKVSFRWNLVYILITVITSYIFVTLYPQIDTVLYARILLTYFVGIYIHRIVYRVSGFNILELMPFLLKLAFLCFIMFKFTNLLFSWLIISDIFVLFVLKVLTGIVIYIVGIYILFKKEFFDIYKLVKK